MEPRKRMFRVWGWLVVSMTGGSALLLWLEPESPQQQAILSAHQCQLQARRAAESCPEPVADWTGIELIGVDMPASRNSALTAVTPLDDVHFLVATTGNMIAYPNWRNQQRINGERQIRIGLVLREDDELRRAQIVGLRALVVELNSLMADPKEHAPLPIRLDARRKQIPLAADVIRLVQANPNRS